MGYDLLVQQTEGNSGWKDRLIELAAIRAVDGVIASVALEPWDEFSKPLSGLPLFSCDQAVDRPEIPGVYIDHLRSTLEGLEAPLRSRMPRYCLRLRPLRR
jgi:DNA-binding LacI/PurR family transcriptional regulator